MTNGDCIRKMSDEELARWLYMIMDCACCPCFIQCNTCDCAATIDAWLAQEAKDE